jgi:hypothetical protein
MYLLVLELREVKYIRSPLSFSECAVLVVFSRLYVVERNLLLER